MSIPAALLLTLNAGSSSLKFALYDATPSLTRRAVGQVEGLGARTTFAVRCPADGNAGGTAPQGWPLPDGADHHAALDAILHWLATAGPGGAVIGVSHRVVHGGSERVEPVVLDDAIVTELQRLVPLAPLHQPHNLAGVAAARRAFPGVPQIACFDTAFHRSHPFVADTFALPRRYYAAGVRRYGFHGLSYEYILRRLASQYGALAQQRVVIAHLGNGASMCAVREGRSVASTMGFTALDGLPMGTRCGQLDPGALLYLMTEQGLDAPALSDLLYRQSGLLGLSGESHDVRLLEASSRPEASEALDYFIERARRELAGLTASLGGLDAVVMTGGIGEHSVRVRAGILGQLEWMGVHLDEAANRHHAPAIHTPDSRVALLVIPTDEEQMLAGHAWDILQSTPAALASSD